MAAIGFASVQSGGIGQLQLADLLLFGAVVSAAIGYAEGGLLARELGAWQTVSWALVLASPLMVGHGGLLHGRAATIRHSCAMGGLRVPWAS